jgi:hypothetical protein
VAKGKGIKMSDIEKMQKLADRLIKRVVGEKQKDGWQEKQALVFARWRAYSLVTASGYDFSNGKVLARKK